MSEPNAILIAAASGRGLANAARQSGYSPLVVDFFGDSDTRALAAATREVADPARGFESDELLAYLRELAADTAPAGLVYGSGFEDRHEILDLLARHFSVFGNDAQTLARAKDPRALATLCQELQIPHPEIAFAPPRDPDNWLVKRQGGGGGLHVRLAGEEEVSPGEYFQRRVSGAPVSVLLLGDGNAAQILGTSSQWTTPWPGMPFRFGGAVRPALDPAQLAVLSDAARKIAAALDLVGLNSVDFLADAASYHLIEVNPRPGATLDIFADAEGALFAAHLAACRGHLPERPLVFTKAAATAIAYAPHELPSMPGFVWPDWCKDRQRSGTSLRAGDPVCTILAEAETAAAARALVAERLALFEAQLLREAQKECAA